MFLNQALVFTCSIDNMHLMMMVIQVFGDKMESNRSLGFTFGSFAEQELLESVGLW